MTEFILSELRFLAWSMFMGVKLGIVYALITEFRRIFHHYQLLMAIEDVAYWLYAAAIMYFTICMANDGKMRIFAIGGMFFALAITSIILKYLEKKATIIYIRLKERQKRSNGGKKAGGTRKNAGTKSTDEKREEIKSEV